MFHQRPSHQPCTASLSSHGHQRAGLMELQFCRLAWILWGLWIYVMPLQHALMFGSLRP